MPRDRDNKGFSATLNVAPENMSPMDFEGKSSPASIGETGC